MHFITGATGLLGSHLAEQLRQRGESVRALVRPGSDTAFLRSIGVELAEGDLVNPASVRPALVGVGRVYHCAAKVGDWGPWRAFQTQTIDATGHLLDACRQEGVGRFVHVSSIMVYGHPQERAEPFTEDEPRAQNLRVWDYYCRSKIEAERLVEQYPGDWTIARPSWIYGPRDRNTFPRIFRSLRSWRVFILGKGDRLVNCIYAGDVADGVLRAADSPLAVRQAYNLSSDGELTQRELLDFLCDMVGRRRVRWHMPVGVAYAGGMLSEVIGKMIFLRRPPHITRYAVGLILRSTRYSTAKAREQLGWSPRMPLREGLQHTWEWFKQQNNAAVTR